MNDFEASFLASLANTEDVARLASLERAGHFPEGFTENAESGVLAYTWRLVWLRAKYAAEPYPGPRTL